MSQCTPQRGRSDLGGIRGRFGHRALSRRMAALVGLLAIAGCTPVEVVAVPTSGPLPSIARLRQSTPAPTTTGTPRVVATVTATPTPAPTRRSIASPTPTSTGPGSSCARRTQREVRDEIVMTATAGAGSATLTWPYTGDPDILSFRIAAVPTAESVIPGRPPTQVQWLSIDTAHDCRPVVITTRIPGLTSKKRYSFWLIARYTRHDGLPGVGNRQVGRSMPVTIG